MLLVCIAQAQKPGRTQPRVFTDDGYCHPRAGSSRSNDSLWAALFRRDTVFTPEVRQRFSTRSRSVAADLGVVSLLHRFAVLEKAERPATALELLRVRLQLQERIAAGSFEVNDVRTELECEQGRATELKNYLDARNARRVSRRTVISVVSGALTALVSGALTLANASNGLTQGLAIGGSAFSSFWALRALKGEAQHPFRHRRNALRELMENPAQSAVFPPAVWHYLTRESEGLPTVRDVVLERWGELNLMGDVAETERQQRAGLLFGNGGTYGPDDASVRISLLDLLSDEVSMMDQELKQLQQELVVANPTGR